MQGGTPVLPQDVARVELGPEERRGIAELNGQGGVVSGIALQRDGQNALHVIDSMKQKLAETAPSLPKGARSTRSMTAPISFTARSRRSSTRLPKKASSSRWSASSFCCMSAALWSPFSCFRSAC
jgi:hypothetical protein